MWSAGALPAPREEACSSGLLAVDGLVCATDSEGVILVRTPSLEVASAVEHHVIRRSVASQRTVVRVSTDADSCWRDACAQLGVARVPAEPSEAARALIDASGRGVIVVMGDVREGTWDHAVWGELERMSTPALVVMIQWGERPTGPGAREMIHVRGSQEDFDTWWGAIVQDAASRATCESIAELDAWWSWSSRRMDSVPLPDVDSLSGEARGLIARLRLTGRSWPARWKATLGSAPQWDELFGLDVVVEHAGHFCLSPLAAAVEQEPTGEDLRRVADTLRTRFSQEPWALARAGVLYARAGEKEHAEACLSQALHALDDALARREVWDGWGKALGRMPVEQRRKGALFAAELALDRDDVDVSLELAHVAGGGDAAAPFEAHYVLGRAQLARGDVVAARVSLERAFARSVTDDERAGALAQMAEVAYAVGELDQASRHAREAAVLATSATIRLDASNTLGKVMLARSSWTEAESHFAGNESTAAAAGLVLAQLRARVNRAIALLSRGQGEAARGILEQVLEDARQRHDQRAAAFALSNLAVLAIERHDYPEALGLSEAAIDARRRLGDKVGLSRVVTNLAELRLRLGLLAEAEQTLAFGRQALRPVLPPTRVAHFALVAARIRLAHGDTFEASREIGVALSNVAGSSDGAMIGECHRVEARIALDDGDVDRAARAIERAESDADEPFARAEVALLQARLAQAVGRDARELASDALAAARQANDEDLLRDANVLVAELHRVDGRWKDARRCIDEAKRVRDHVAEALPSSLRSRYLARRDMHRLSAVEDSIGAIALEPAVRATERPLPMRAEQPERGRFVGRHATVVRLLAAVEKVARSGAPVLVLGESGTGKELIAEALHNKSDRRAGPLVKVNCAALVDTLLLSELFGHEKGAFTGATARRRGRFEMADGGTLFLDEIGDISPKTQVALLRVLQDGTFERVGGGTTLRGDVRVVCATHRDLAAMVAEGTFREDLYYRLSGVTLRVPALRERLSDMGEIAQHLLHQIGQERTESPKRLTPEVLAVLYRHRWPGNVRELDNVLRAASLFSETEDIAVDTVLEHVPVRAEQAFSTPSKPSVEALAPLPVAAGEAGAETLRLAYDEIRTQGTSLSDLKRNIERECIRQALVDSDGNITRAAALLGMKRPRLSQLVKQYSLLEGSLEDLS